MLATHKKVILFSILGFLLLILAVAVTLFTYQRAYAGKIYKNVYFADLNLSGKNRSEAVASLNDKLSGVMDDQITITGNSKSITAKVSDTGLSFDVPEIVARGYLFGRSGSFLRDLKTSFLSFFKKNDLAVTPSLNQSHFDDFLKVAVNQLNSDPQNASLKIINGVISATEATDGMSVDTTSLADKIIGALNTNNLTIELASNATPATVKTADFVAARATAERYMNRDISFTYNSNTYKPTRSDIGNWIEFDQNNGQYSAALNDTNVKAYLAIIAKNFEVVKVDTKVNSLDGTIITAGVQGIYLNKDAALASLKAQINNAGIGVAMTVTTTDPVIISVLPAEGFVPGRFPGKYIDIDLAQQKLCQIEGQNIVACYPISSGKAAMPTPTGTYGITSKSPRQFSSKYGLWMPWWEQFSGAYGIHELPETDTWKEVPDHLGTPVSHGCVRLGVGPAQALYDWTSIGTPVYIHK